MISDSGKALLTDLVLYVTLPASILKSFQIEFSHQILVSCLSVIAVAVGIQIGAWLLGMILYPGFPDERKKVLQYATICSNAGILGNPIAEGIFGSMGLLYASIYTIPQRTFMWSIGMTYFTQAPDAKTLIRKVSTHPCILSVVAGLLIMVLQIPLPGFISLTIKNIAGGNTFLAMALVGTILAEVPLQTLPERDTIYYSFIRLFLFHFWSGWRVTLHRLTILLPVSQLFYQVCLLPVSPLFLRQNMVRMRYLRRNAWYCPLCFR